MVLHCKGEQAKHPEVVRLLRFEQLLNSHFGLDSLHAPKLAQSAAPQMSKR